MILKNEFLPHKGENKRISRRGAKAQSRYSNNNSASLCLRASASLRELFQLPEKKGAPFSDAPFY